ncbi:jg19267 [Pararge aegeria aegeria]|uniref:Jg19267 protein n=1 Tax=Pararge aegeria aegeria TaxID=348720 RepID=A0A8S4RLG3_9NEOP|nr:jg19267 [Pararge aegeria aegeria]
MTRHDDRRAPTTFLYATERRFLSSLLSSTPVSVTSFIAAAMSSYRSACSASLARCTNSSLSTDIFDDLR